MTGKAEFLRKIGSHDTNGTVAADVVEMESSQVDYGLRAAVADAIYFLERRKDKILGSINIRGERADYQWTIRKLLEVARV